MRAEALAVVFPGVHPRALTRVSTNPTYVSAGREEYLIEQEGPLWYVRRWKRGLLPPQLRTRFTSFRACEDTLIAYLKSKDKWGKAMYPGKEPNGKSQD